MAAHIKIPVIYTDEYNVYIEPVVRQGKVQYFVHSTVWNWSPSIAKQLKQDWERFRECFSCPVYSAHTAEQRQAIKFSKVFGFTELERLTNKKGQDVIISVHRT
jgi:hypothetical protein